MENYKKIKNLLEGDYELKKLNGDIEIVNLEEDIAKFFERGNNSAGTRVRKAMQELKTLAQALRLEVQEAKQA